LNGGFGWFNEWQSSATLRDGSITSPGLNLSYTAALPVIGNALSLSQGDAVSVSATRTLTTTGRFTVLNAFENIGELGTDLWFSFVAQDHFTNSSPPTWGGLRLFPNSQDNPSNDIFIGKFADNPHQWGLGWQVDSTGHVNPNPAKSQIIPTAIQQDVSYLLVGHLESLPTGEKISLFVNPTSIGAAPGVPDAQLNLPLGEFVFSKVQFEVGDSLMNFTFDELTFGTDYASVALNLNPNPRVDAVPEPGSAGLLGLVALLVAARRRREQA